MPVLTEKGLRATVDDLCDGYISPIFVEKIRRDLAPMLAAACAHVREPSAETVAVPIYPAQCKCGHIFLERYQFSTPTPEGVIGFCWCGFCRTRVNVLAPAQPSGQPAEGDAELVTLVYEHFKDERTLRCLLREVWKDSISIDEPNYSLKQFAEALSRRQPAAPVHPTGCTFEVWLSYQPYLEDHGPLPITDKRMYLEATVKGAWIAGEQCKPAARVSENVLAMAGRIIDLHHYESNYALLARELLRLHAAGEKGSL